MAQKLTKITLPYSKYAAYLMHGYENRNLLNLKEFIGTMQIILKYLPDRVRKFIVIFQAISISCQKNM
jgi:hypothetical protein